MASLSYQLYSSRNWEAEQTFAMLQGLGVQEVEGFGPFIEDAATTAKLLEQFGMSMPTAHVGLAMVQDDAARVIETAKALGIQTVFVPYLMPEQRPEGAAAWATFAKDLAVAIQPLKSAGLQVGWHNHEFEFEALEDGSFPIEYIADADADLVLELDLAWIDVAGQDPVAWLNKHKGRVAAAHIKDRAKAGEASDEDGWADVGFGTMDWDRIVVALTETQVPRLVLEHDNPSDHQRFASRSVATVKSWKH